MDQSNAENFTYGGHMDSDRKARIAHRKVRIETNRLAKMKPEKTDETSVRRKPRVEQDSKEVGKSKLQVSNSRKKIDGVQLSSTELVTNVRVAVVGRESIRRTEEAKKYELWEQKKRDEAEKSLEEEENISTLWDSTMKLEGPYELNDALSKQKGNCDKLIGIKTRLINAYIAELKIKDDDYVKELRRQSEEIDTLIERTNTQYRGFQKTLKEEVEQIERSFVEERTEMMESNIKEVENLFETRCENERTYMEERSNRIEDHTQQLEQVRVNDAEEYNLVKIKLETDVQVLEQQLQQMRGTYQLNTEKLEYNFQVLKKREEENGTILTAQKRKITRWQDHLNVLKAKLAKQEKTFSQEHQSLNEDYKRITEQFKELQKKFRHFQMSDSKTFKDVWKMNEELGKEFMRKVLQADRIIHEQQLGLTWQSPPEDIFKSIDPSIFHPGVDENAFMIDFEEKSGILGDLIDKKRDDDNNNLTGGMGERRDSLTAKFKEFKGNSKIMKKVLELLCNEAGFLVEDKLQKLLSPLHKDEQSLMKLDSIFKAIGVDTVDDIEDLSNYFIERVESPIKNNENEGKYESLIHPNDAIHAIRTFVEHHRNSKSKKKDNDFDRIMNDVDENSDELQPSQMKNAGAKTKAQYQKQYWEKMTLVLDDQNYRIWVAVYEAMETYKKHLSERQRQMQEVTHMSHQNAELKQLLRQYMAGRVNNELHVPPTMVLLAQAQTGCAIAINTDNGDHHVGIHASHAQEVDTHADANN